MECGLLMCHQSGVVLAAATQVACGARGVLSASSLAGMLRKGMVLTRSESGVVTAYPSSVVRQGRALQIGFASGKQLPPVPQATVATKPAVESEASGQAAPSQVQSPPEAMDEQESPPNGKLLDESAVNSSWLGCSPHGANDVLKWDWLAGFKAP